MSVIVELPLVTAEEIVAEYRPGGGATVKATLRRLRTADLVSEGLSRRPRASAGRVAGVLHVYSALNLEAARAARLDDLPTARRIAEAAGRIEQLADTSVVVSGLAGLGGSASLRRRFDWATSLEPSLRDALRAVVEETVTSRQRLVNGDALTPPRLGVVTKLHGEVADLKIEGAETPVPMLIADLEPLDSAFVGAPLALRFEPFGRGRTLIKATPAIKLSDNGDPSRIYPYERPLPGITDPIRLAETLGAAPTIRRPRKIEIAGSR